MNTIHRYARSAIVAGSAFVCALPASAQFTRISVGPEGQQLTQGVDDPAISDDGTKILYSTYEDGVLNPKPVRGGGAYLYLYDTTLGVNTQIDLSEIFGPDMGLGSWTLSGDGRFAAVDIFLFNPCCTGQVYLIDLESGAIELVSRAADGTPGDRSSSNPSVSLDGRFVAFSSDSTNLVEGDTNDASDVFVYDRLEQASIRVSVSSAGVQADGYSYSPSISSDGTRVAFESYSTNLVEGDTNFEGDIFVNDRSTGMTRRLSQRIEGEEVIQGDCASFDPSISGDGTAVAFTSCASNLAGTRGFEGGNAYLATIETGEIRALLSQSYQGLPLCDVYNPRITDDASLVTVEAEYCDDFFDRPARSAAPRPERGGHVASRGGSFGFYGIFGIGTASGDSFVVDRLANGESAEGYDHDLAGQAAIIAFESTIGIDPNDTNEGEDIYIGNVCTIPTFAQQPLDDEELEGTPAVLTARVGMAIAPDFRWYFEGKPLENSETVSGADTETLIINPVSLENTGTYQLLVFSPCGANETESVELNVVAAPCRGDANLNGIINFDDVTEVLNYWYQGCDQNPR